MIRKLKNYFHLLQASSANVLYGFPSRKLIVIGVTGTDGKTTTTSLIYHVLRESGLKVAMISTVGAYIGDKEYDTGFHVTTPSSFLLQKYIKKVKESGSQILVLEVTSHALDQYRAFGIQFQVGVLTNVSHEHLDYHKTHENYVNSKVRLLKSAQLAIINQDDHSYNLVNSKLKSKEVITYGLSSVSDVNPERFPFQSTLVGEFNKYNTLAAVAVCKVLGIGNTHIEKALKTFTSPPGRQEIVWNKEFSVMIDFAHTPNAFAKLLPAVKKLSGSRLIHVFGAAGERDHTKRPKMGEEAAKFDDVIVLTAEDPRSESIQSIVRDIELGIKNYELWKEKKILFEIPDRRKAIEFAIGLAQKGDLVLLTGKSHEKSMNMGHGEEPWDEFNAAHAAIKLKVKNEK